MTADEARDEMLAVLKLLWDALTDVGTPVYTDLPNNVTDNLPWVRVSVRHATGAQSSLSNHNGERKFTATGVLWLQVFAPVGDGLTNAYRVASALVTAYSKAYNGQVWYRNPRLVEVGTNGGFEQINVMVNFTYDETR